MAMGVPKELGTFTETHASLELRGENVFPSYVTGNPDYYDFEVNINLPGTPQDFGGFSGGGFWGIPIYQKPSKGKNYLVQPLKGVIFFQNPPVDCPPIHPFPRPTNL